MTMPDANKYAVVNGLKMYYEIHGTGTHLVILHGELGGVGVFKSLLSEMAETHQVIAVELQAHGHTADVDRPLSFEFMADDIAALIKHLNISNVDILGYSLGGSVALQTAIRHPKLVRKLVTISTPYKSSGWYAEFITQVQSINADVAKTFIGLPTHMEYVSSAPNPDDWPTLCEKIGKLFTKKYDWSKNVVGIESPIMIVIGDADGVRISHAVEFFELFGGGKKYTEWDESGKLKAQLAILPATTHYDILSSSALTSTVMQFLDAPMPEPDWMG